MWHHLREPFDHLLRSLVHAHPLALQHDGVQEGVLPELQLVPQRGALFACTHSTRRLLHQRQLAAFGGTILDAYFSKTTGSTCTTQCTAQNAYDGVKGQTRLGLHH